MTQEDKELLLKDLCARLPYKPQVEIIEDGISITSKLTTTTIKYLEYGRWNVKPYLFPLSSITEEQKEEFNQLLELELKAINDEIDHTQATAFEIDFYNKHHLDWRGLIPMNLAIDATNLNIY